MNQFPPEILQKIIRHCKVIDILSLACCDKEHYDLMNPFLWENVKIPLWKPVDFCLANVGQFTRQLNLVLKNERNSTDKAFSAGMKLSKVVNACDPAKVNVLKLGSIKEDGVGYALQVLCNISSLWLHGFSGNMSQCDKLGNLKMVHLEDCHINNETAKEITRIPALANLTLRKTSGLTDGVIQSFGNIVNLKKLVLYQCKPSAIKVKYISGLENLTILTIYEQDIKDGHLAQLCSSLKELITLCISKSTFTDAGLRNLSLLTKLRGLRLYRNPLLTGDCFLHVSNVQHLRKIYFSVDMCQRDEHEFDSVALLNVLNELEDIIVYSEPDDIGDVLLSLCSGKEWKLKVEQRRNKKDDIYRLRPVLSM